MCDVRDVGGHGAIQGANCTVDFVASRVGSCAAAQDAQEHGIARYQVVQTHPEHRRKGLCGTLVSAAATYGRENMGAETFVMIADPEYHAGRVYNSVGFEVRERVGGLERAP